MRVLTLLVAALAFFSAAPGAQAEQRFALLIANLHYKPGVGELNNPKRDIDIVESALKKIGFSDTTIEKKVDVTADELRRAVKDHVERVKAAGKGAWSFFYYSGHGAARGRASATAERGENYLIPYDLESTQQPDFWDRSVALKEIGEMLEGAPEAVHFIIFDACRTELIIPERALTGRGFVPVPFSEQPGMLYAFASAPNSFALDAVGKEDNGPYAVALAKEIVKAGIDYLHLFANIRTEVLNHTGHRQTPWIRDGFLSIVYMSAPEVPTKPGEAQCLPVVERTEVKPIEWEPVAQGRILFTRSSVTLAEPRADAPAIEDIEKDEVHRIAPGSKIAIGKVEGRPAWFRYTPEVGSRRERFVSVDDARLLN